MNKNIQLTVFTPAYNRAHTLPRTLESLRKQENKNFIWLIIDDGSTDSTQELVESWLKEDYGFQIKYIYKENGGMHTAHNVAYENIDTELNVCIDSDDCLADNAVNIILNLWENIKDSDRYAGIVGLDATLDGRIIGTRFTNVSKEITLNGFYEQGGTGDKKLVYRTDIMKQLPKYPVFEDEKYVSLGYKYLLCDQNYVLYPINEILCNVEYQLDGSSHTMWKQYLKNPKGFSFIRKEHMKYHKSKKRLCIDNIHYVSSSLLSRNKHFIKESPMKLLTILMIPFGWILSLLTIYKASKL